MPANETTEQILTVKGNKSNNIVVVFTLKKWLASATRVKATQMSSKIWIKETTYLPYTHHIPWPNSPANKKRCLLVFESKQYKRSSLLIGGFLRTVFWLFFKGSCATSMLCNYIFKTGTKSYCRKMQNTINFLR